MMRGIGRTVLALLLAFAVVSPAAAELRCFEEAVGYSTALNGTALLDASVPSPHEDERHGTQDSSASCSFSHCAQWVPIDPAARGSAAEVIGGLTYPPSPAQRLAASPRDGPERPPRA